LIWSSKTSLILFFLSGFTLHEDYFPAQNRNSVFMFLVKTLDRTGIHTYAAKYAGKWITYPGGGLFVHRDALGRAFNGTYAAEGAIFNIVVQLTPHVCKGRPYFVRVTPGGFA
jgi:hypothetical protein